MKADNLFTFIGGMLVGAAVAILFAPDSGDETRRKIKDTFDKEYQGLKDRINSLRTPETAPQAEQEAAE
ncbi:MAG TPA: YtxH domain-containing protein [Candidatus Coprenecus stercoravium]|uniref:YtxH domain-containing protein n=1 Tax=Candidatus Coprenecus stercoravium TaxID=2840735 RepID=A0A9D2GPN0_9BACT|nr:YtxH domain-containing protein [Candidatus Coprenecus stercoravium]